MPITDPLLRVLEACRGARTSGPLILRPLSGQPIDRRDAYRMVTKIAKVAGIPRHISPHSLRHAAITNALDAGVPGRRGRRDRVPHRCLGRNPSRAGKPLRGDLAGIHSARRGTYRVLYRINEETREGIVLRVEHRSDAYRPD